VLAPRLDLADVERQLEALAIPGVSFMQAGRGWYGVLLAFALAVSVTAQEEAKPFIPRRQSKPPGPALSPQAAMEKMQVPEGFTVELVASEPDLVNPVAMAIDERGRFWVTESFEYPRREPGPGKDRIKILEDTDGDGKAEKVTIFAEGLNIPSGIAVGYGGVWVANAPDILFLQDTNGDGKADKQEVIVTGFGRFDTHELPNSFTWGPDGYLYGLNGVFNAASVVYPKESPNYKEGQKPWNFTCAMFRIHPVKKTFEVFCEGTSNPWGIAFDNLGSAFVSACVIDHLWHLTETGYYHRQGGPYPPFTWKLESIVKHQHQLAAYCGIHYFDSDAYPEKYRNKLFMGNIHGGCINVDKLTRRGSTYFGETDEDFLTANDPWFMPVVQKTGADGSLYILDWYDRYHCYQDANADPKGIDRANGRLYRVRYKDTPRVKDLDLAKDTDDQLVKRLEANNDFIRATALRLLQERHAAPHKGMLQSEEALQAISLNAQASMRQRLLSLWAVGGNSANRRTYMANVLKSSEAELRAWGVRLLGNEHQDFEEIASLADDPSPDVKLQVAIAARKMEGGKALPLLVKIAANCGDDPLIPQIVWQNLHPLLETEGPKFLTEVKKYDLKASPGLAAIMPRATERILAKKK
jgi:glucose/arabinose dehydrogenase